VWKSDKEIKKECAIRAQAKVLVYMAVAALEKVGIMEDQGGLPLSTISDDQMPNNGV
jgi:hypothetical protein